MDISLKITGQGRIGADGLGIWYTAQMGSLGPVFGANDFWTGMGEFGGRRGQTRPYSRSIPRLVRQRRSEEQPRCVPDDQRRHPLLRPPHRRHPADPQQ